MCKAGKRRSVLMAEDVDSNAAWQIEALEHFGCSVRRASNGAEAFVLMMAERFDIVLMDYRMPMMDGAEATQAIRDFETAMQRPRSPIVMVTASLMPDEQLRCRESGADDLLPKPFTLEHLGETLDRWVGERANV